MFAVTKACPEGRPWPLFVTDRAERTAKAAELGIWSLPPPPTEAEAAVGSGKAVVYHGNRRSRVFHAPWCRYYYCKNCAVIFKSREEAIKAGYRPGGHCHP